MRARFACSWILLLAAVGAAQDTGPAESRPETPFCILVRQTWSARHQAIDGSWSPAGFQLHCSGGHPCTGPGQESFRVAATALLLLVHANAGQSDGSPRRALDYLLSTQRDGGGFAEFLDPSKDMNNACAAIALSRALVLASRGAESRPADLASRAEKAVARVAGAQARKGGWGWGETDLAHGLSASVWSMLALKAGSTAGFSIDNLDLKMRSALTAIERMVARTEAPPAPHQVTPAERIHARAVRAVARVACGLKPADLAEDVNFVLQAVKPNQDPPPDAEVLLFTTIAALKCGGSPRDQWLRLVKTHVVESQVKDGCAEGTWSTPTIWWDQGGRLVSTALMTWTLEFYYRYPLADWI